MKQKIVKAKENNRKQKERNRRGDSTNQEWKNKESNVNPINIAENLNSKDGGSDKINTTSTLPTNELKKTDSGNLDSGNIQTGKNKIGIPIEENTTK